MLLIRRAGGRAVAGWKVLSNCQPVAVESKGGRGGVNNKDILSRVVNIYKLTIFVFQSKTAGQWGEKTTELNAHVVHIFGWFRSNTQIAQFPTKNEMVSSFVASGSSVYVFIVRIHGTTNNISIQYARLGVTSAVSWTITSLRFGYAT